MSFFVMYQLGASLKAKMDKRSAFSNQMCSDPELLTLRLIPFFMALIMCSFVSYLSRKLTQFE
jgi:hypothetical protein